MVEFFNDYRHHDHRGVQIWQILVGKAHNRQTVTYEILARLLGIRGAGVLHEPLGRVAFYCRQHSLPPLTNLVVNKHKGVPGADLTDHDPTQDREEVFQYNWYNVYPPTREDYAKANELGWDYLPPT
jgi:putative restriction endonuclease